MAVELTIQAQNFFSQTLTYIFSTLGASILKGDPTALALAGIIGLIILALFFQLEQLVYHYVKRFLLFLIILASLLIFILNFQDKIFSNEPDIVILAIGIAGFLIGLFAFAVSLFSVHSSYTNIAGNKGTTEEQNKNEMQTVKDAQLKAQTTQTQKAQFPETTETKQNQNMNFAEADKSFLAVLSYVIIAQFGVFSGVTISAPSIEVGMVFAAAFFVGIFIFIKTSYHNYTRGVKHLVLASLFGLALSIVLGHFWDTTPLADLLSLAYFKSNALVAFVTGIAVSLLIGSKH